MVRTAWKQLAPGRALAFDSPRYQTVKTILNKGLEQQPIHEDLLDSLTATYTGKGRLSRDTRKLLIH